MTIFVPAWGETHIELFTKALGRSLSWPRNRLGLQNAKWIILSEEAKDAQTIESFIKDEIHAQAEIQILIDPRLSLGGVTTEKILLNHLISVIEKLIGKDSFLMATPDYIFGDGTIPNLQTIGGHEDLVASFAHMRVLDTILEELDEDSNPSLITKAFKHQHESWVKSNEDSFPGITYHGGIFWRQLDPKLMAVTHYLPAPFYANFTKADLDFFKAEHQHQFNHRFPLWDHVWTGLLLHQGRLRYIGSSDIAAMVEITEEHSHLTPHNPPGKINESGYAGNLMNNDIHKQFIYTMRSE